jgi:hypothetical protein
MPSAFLSIGIADGCEFAGLVLHIESCPETILPSSRPSSDRTTVDQELHLVVGAVDLDGQRRPGRDVPCPAGDAIEPGPLARLESATPARGTFYGDVRFLT